VPIIVMVLQHAAATMRGMQRFHTQIDDMFRFFSALFRRSCAALVLASSLAACNTDDSQSPADNLTDALESRVDHTQYDTASILRLITRRFGLPLLPGIAARDAALRAAGGQPMGDLTNGLNL
jgi:hypothetical protein